MKRFLASVLAAVCVLSAASCDSPVKSQSSRQNKLGVPFTAKMSVSLDKLNAEGSLTRTADNCWEAEFDSPNTLSGVKLTFTDNTVSASYKGLDFSVPKSAVPVKAMLNNLIEAIDALDDNEELEGAESDGLFRIDGSLDGGAYTLSLDKEGCISTFEMPNNLLKIAFSEVSFNTPSPAVTSTVTETASTEVTTTEAATSEK